MTKLPKPSKPYEDWASLVEALWSWGRGHCEPEWAELAGEKVAEVMARSLLPVTPDDNPQARPSGFLTCGRQLRYLEEGVTPDPMPRDLGLTFAMGHTLHEVSYAYVRSALPEGFSVAVEVAATMPDWWPTDNPLFKEGGTMDMVLRVEDPAMIADYLSPAAGNSALVDFKTMAGFGWKRHKGSAPGKEPDGFGYISQLAVYSDGGRRFDEVILAGINRDILQSPLACRKVGDWILAAEAERLGAAFDGELREGFDFLERNGADGLFYCGNGRQKKGYCPFKTKCLADREAEGYRVFSV